MEKETDNRTPFHSSHIVRDARVFFVLQKGLRFSIPNIERFQDGYWIGPVRFIC